jgi:hypothetical protein
MQKLNQGKENRQFKPQLDNKKYSCITPIRRMKRRGREGNCTLQKKNSIEDLVGSEENAYSVPDTNKIMINVTNELSGVPEKSLKEEILEQVTEKLMEKLKTWLTRKYKIYSRNFKAHTHQKKLKKNLPKIQKHLDELREYFNKHQRARKDTIKKRYMKYRRQQKK